MPLPIYYTIKGVRLYLPQSKLRMEYHYLLPKKSLWLRVLNTFWDLDFTIDIPQKMALEISSVEQPSSLEPLVCPGILDYQYQGSLSVLLGNLTSKPIQVKKGQAIGRAMLVPI